MKSKKTKLLVLLIFLLLVLGGGFLISRNISRNAIKKTGVKTDFNPGYIDSAVRAKSK